MKHLHLILTLSLVMVLANDARADSFDSDMATVKKGKCDKCAKVLLDKKTYDVPISFGDGADWSSVRDHYELSSGSESCLKSGKAKVSVASDGTLSWRK